MNPANDIRVLLLAADSGEGDLGDFIDPRLRAHWAEEGILTRSLYISALRREDLRQAHAVILLRTPIPGHSLKDEPVFQRKLPWLRGFVARGGGLLALFTECYGKSEASLNELLEPWGLRAFFNELVPAPGVQPARLPRFFESVLLPARVDPATPWPMGCQEFTLITAGGHGTQHLTLEPAPGSAVEWRPVLRGGPAMTSRPYTGAYTHSSAREIPDPLLAAAAEVDQGRVLVFPGSSSFWIVNPFIWRFAGALLEDRHRAGYRLLTDGLRWISAHAKPETAKAWENEARPTNPDQFSFRSVPHRELHQLRTSTSRRIWLGTTSCARDELRVRAASWSLEGYALALPLADYRALDESSFAENLATGEALSGHALHVLPGYELCDDEGVRSAVISPGPFPRHTLRYPNSTLLENVWIPVPGCVSILRTPLQNRIPAQRYGGYNLIEFQPGEAWLSLYRQLVASKYFIAPVAFDEQPGRPGTRALVPHDCTPFDAIRTNRHTTYVTDGPELTAFRWEGPGLIEDDWEGYWYGYTPGDEATVVLGVSSTAPLAEVTLYDGEEVIRHFQPGQRTFAFRLPLRLWRDFALHVTARDAEGRRLHATYPLYTRNRTFWGHVGSDQMNNYVNCLQPAPRGFLGVGHELYDPFGFVTFGAGWGDYLRMTPALPYGDFMPRQEISLTLGSFNVHHPSALLRGRGGLRQLNDHRRVFAFCGADAHFITSTLAGEHSDHSGPETETWHGRPVHPTRAFRPVAGAKGSDAYIVWRWRPRAPILVEVRKCFSLSPSWCEDEWFSFAANAHYLLPGLRLGSPDGPSLAARDVCVLPPAPANGKEWDPAHALRTCLDGSWTVFSPEGGRDIEIGHGGVGTLGVFPLGTARAGRCLAARTDRELQVVFQCRLTGEERARGEFEIRYLLALDAGESEASPFARTLLPRLGGAGERALSRVVDATNTPGPIAIELGPREDTVYLELTGLPACPMEARDAQGRFLFGLQPKQGRSFHLVPPDFPDRFILVPEGGAA